jgi:uncharacterized protein (DUF433 family)
MTSLPPIRIPHPHVEVRADLLDGSPVVRGTKVPVRRLFSWHRKGTSAETLLRRYPSLGAARVLDALSFAYDHLDLMEADLERERSLVGPVDEPPTPMRQQDLPFDK